MLRVVVVEVSAPGRGFNAEVCCRGERQGGGLMLLAKCLYVEQCRNECTSMTNTSMDFTTRDKDRSRLRGPVSQLSGR